MTETMPAEIIFTLVKWLIIIVIWLLLAIDLYHDSTRFKRFKDSSMITELLKILHKRNLHIYGLATILLIVMFATDARQELHKKDNAEQTVQEEPTPKQGTPVTKPQANTSTLALPEDSKIPFSNIPEFNETNGKQQAYIDLLKQRYETWLITYYYLKKCSKVNSTDYDIIISSMKRELDNMHADSTVGNNILLAANGSYKEMYSDIPCDEAHINSTKAGYDKSMQQIAGTTQQPAPPAAAASQAAH